MADAGQGRRARHHALLWNGDVLTNYLTATVLVLGIGHLIGRPTTWSVGTTIAICVAVVTLQWCPAAAEPRPS